MLKACSAEVKRKLNIGHPVQTRILKNKILANKMAFKFPSVETRHIYHMTVCIIAKGTRDTDGGMRETKLKD